MVTLLIPFKADYPERRTNLDVVKRHYAGLEYMVFDVSASPFHRTAYLNAMLKSCKTPVAVLLDADAIVHRESLEDACMDCLNGAVLSYPYDGRFLDVPAEAKNLSISDWAGMSLQKLSPADNSVGGAVVVNVQKYLEMGGENENFMQWGEEDLERVHRVLKLGGKVTRQTGALYHLNHPRCEADNFGNPYIDQNRAEFKKVQSMTADQLWDYVRSWCAD